MNWARTNVVVVPITFSPSNSQELAAAVVQAESEGGSVKAVGSGWSYSTAAVDDSVTHVINTALLSKRLSADPDNPDATDKVIPLALRDGLRPVPGGGSGRQFVHVEAGISIYELNFMLDGLTPRLAMRTMGGANGQSLAGVLSTGTHGADFNLPPIADSVCAIHLVGPAGQEWWLERSGEGAITDSQRLATARDSGLLCSDIKIVYDETLFRAALVSLGRMGVVYSVVLEVRPAFRLHQSRFKSDWTSQLSWIRDTVVASNGADVEGRFREIVVNPYANAAGARECMVTTRTETDEEKTSMPPASVDPFRLICDIEGLDGILVAALLLIPILIGAATAAALATIAWMLAIPFVGAILYAIAAPVVVATATAAILALESAIIVVLAAGPGGVADKLAGLCNMASAIGQQALVRDIVGAFVGLLRGATPDVVNDGFRLMTEQVQMAGQPRPDDPDCMRHIDGFEFAFDISENVDALSGFMDDVFMMTDDSFNARMPMGFGMSLRITRGTLALIGMQQSVRTAHVEFFFLRGFNGQDDFYSRLHTTAANRGAKPHWGLIHSLDAARVQTLYGNQLTDWRRALGRIVDGGGGNAATFRSKFSLDRNLEPLSGCVVPAPMVRALARLQLRMRWGRVVQRLQRERKAGSGSADR